MDRPNGGPYAGPSGVGRDSIWLTWEDLVEGQDLELEISQVMFYPVVKFEQGREKANLLSLQFKGRPRELGLNQTNRKLLAAMYGNDTRQWIGKKITLYVTQTQVGGQTKNCTRIRDRGQRMASKGEQFLREDDPVGVTAGPPSKSRVPVGAPPPELMV